MRAVAIYPDAQGRAAFEKALAERPDITLCRSFDSFPDLDTLARALRAWAPDILFLDITHPAIEAVNAKLAATFPQIKRVAIHPAQVAEVFRRVLHMGMCELVNPPFRPPQFSAVMDRLIASIEEQPKAARSDCRVTAFLPTKAGVGTSTVAAHVTWAAAQNQEARVLLMDFDRHSGITGFQFDANPEYTVSDALGGAMELDEDTWKRLARSKGNIDLLLSRPGDITELHSDHMVAPLMDFARRSYTSINVDLPDSLDAHTLAAVRQADQIYLVTTSELASLRLARLKATMLQKLNLEGRTRLVLTRVSTKLGLSIQQIEEAVGMEVFATFPCDYEAVCQSLRHAQPSPRLLKSANEFLEKSGAPTKPAVKKWRFLERITIPLNTVMRTDVEFNGTRL